MKPDDSDENLMLAYGAGDAGAFELLYSRHKGPLYRFVLRQAGNTRADELFQDIWMNVIRARAGYRASANFRTWLYRIARNRVIDHYRRAHIRAISDALPVEDIEDSNTHRPDRHAEILDQHAHLLQAIGELPREQRETFLLREEAGLDIGEIADVTGTSHETAKSRLRYAMTKLRAKLATCAGDAP